MKTKLLIGALAAALWGGAALADDYSTDYEADEPVRTGSEFTGSEVDDVNAEVEVDDVDADLGTGGSGMQTDDRDVTVDVNTPAAQPTYVQAPAQDTKKESKSNMRGLTVLLGGGVEGYTGDLAPQIDPGATWGVTAALKPTKVLGIELGYSGAVNEIDNGRRGDGEGTTNGADIVRNGGAAVATVGLTAAPIQPFLLGGIGGSWFQARGDAESEGFSDDFTANVPLGAGLRTHVGSFTADARLNYNVLFDQGFANNVDSRDIAGINSTSGGSYRGTVNIGGTF